MKLWVGYADSMADLMNCSTSAAGVSDVGDGWGEGGRTLVCFGY